MDSPWAYAKRAHLRFVLTTIVLVSLTIYLGIKLYKPPTCFDNKRNQDEVGIDCGGTCALYCDAQVQDMRTSWVQSFEVSPGWWSALAYVENPNFDKQAQKIPYRITVFDSAGALVVQRSGETFVNRQAAVPVFEGRLNVGSRDPYRTTFEWLDRGTWYKAPNAYQVTTEEQVLTAVGVGHDLQVTVVNKEPVLLRDMTVVAIVYDTEGNAIAASETYIDMLGPRGKRRVTFSWPRQFSAPVGRIEFIPRVPLQE